VKAGRGDKLALRWIGRDDAIRDFSYAALGAAANRFANVLTQNGIGKGERVFSLLGRVPELYIAALGTLKNGSVFSPLFSAFGPEPIKARMTIGDARAVITTEAFYRRKIEPWRKELAGPKYPRAAGAALYTHKAFGLHFVTFLVAFAVMCSGLTSAATAARAFAANLGHAFGLNLEGAGASRSRGSPSWPWSAPSTCAGSARA
jgi:hypothetical protein